MKPGRADAEVARYAEMLSAMGTPPRLKIMRLLLSSHPHGMVVGEIQEELEIPGSTLSHHLEKLKNAGLVTVRREQQFLRYAADAGGLRELLGFLYEECRARNRPIRPEDTTLLRRWNSAPMYKEPSRDNTKEE